MWSESVHWVHWLGDIPEGARSTTTSALPWATQHEIQSDLQMIAIFVLFRGILERPSCESCLTTTSARSGANLARGMGYAEDRCFLFERF